MEPRIVKGKFTMKISKPLYLISFGRSFCRGNAESGLKFRAFCGDDWEKTINRRFGEWSIDVFGGTFPRDGVRGRALILFHR